MTAVPRGIFDTKNAWLISLENMIMTLSRLRRDYPTICRSIPVKSLKSVTDLTFTVEEGLDELVSRLMDKWAISHSMRRQWMACEQKDYVKRMSSKRYTVSHSSNSPAGLMRKSRRK